MTECRIVIGEIYFIGSLGWYHLFVFCAVVPMLAWRSRRRVVASDRPLPPRQKMFQATALTLVLFGGFSWWTASAHFLDLFPVIKSPLVAGALGLATYLAAVAILSPYWRRAVLKRKRGLHLFMPQTRTEKAWWIVVSILAGVSEEITWRGVQTTLLAAWLGSSLMAAVVSAVCFGLAHAVQGRRSSAIIVLVALGLQAIVWVTGTLVVAMVVHAAYDITAGFRYSQLGRELGFDPSGEPQPASTRSGASLG